MSVRPLPPNLIRLNGRAPGKDSAGRDIGAPPGIERAAPEAPADLSPEAAAEWERVVPFLDELEVIKPADRAITVSYCELVALVRGLQRTLTAKGMTQVAKVRQADGSTVTKVIARPEVAMLKSLTTELRHHAVELGLTPAAERKALIAAKADTKPDTMNPFAS